MTKRNTSPEYLAELQQESTAYCGNMAHQLELFHLNYCRIVRFENEKQLNSFHSFIRTCNTYKKTAGDIHISCQIYPTVLVMVMMPRIIPRSSLPVPSASRPSPKEAVPCPP